MFLGGGDYGFRGVLAVFRGFFGGNFGGSFFLITFTRRFAEWRLLAKALKEL